MKKIVVFINAIIISAMLIFVVLYSRSENKESFQNRIDQFENTTVTLEQVTENYLEGEQRICDVWVRYINNSNMTIDEAADYTQESKAAS